MFFSLRRDAKEEAGEDMHFIWYDVAPKPASDFAFPSFCPIQNQAVRKTKSNTFANRSDAKHADPKCAEVITKAIALSRDSEIKDPSILTQLRAS